MKTFVHDDSNTDDEHERISDDDDDLVFEIDMIQHVESMEKQIQSDTVNTILDPVVAAYDDTPIMTAVNHTKATIEKDPDIFLSAFNKNKTD